LYRQLPVWASDEQDCFQSQEPQRRIKSCSEIIQRVPHDATAYHNRAVAYELAGDIDGAIADYTKTIEIRPDNAAAYENRGRAYASKGDYTRAVADETKATELIAKSKAHPATGSITKPTKPKTKAIPKPKAAKEAPDSSWWSWLWGDSAAQANVKKTKP
jgi:tetratricopeptide (TPR) repeat protein